MKKDNFDKLMAGMDDALAYAKGDISRGVTHTVHPVDVAAIRKAQGLSQSKFAAKFGFEVKTVQQWEQGRRRPGRAERVLLRVIEQNPHVAEEAARAV